jgi:hypothetical protein
LIAPANEDNNENLRTVEIEVHIFVFSHSVTKKKRLDVLGGTPRQKAIQYLTAEHQPTASQTPEGITQLVKDLAPYDLTKAEKLQIVNLAPTEPVELYVVHLMTLCARGDEPAHEPPFLDCGGA